MKLYASSVSPKGQITLPVEVRRLLSIKPKDQVCIQVEGDEVKIVSLKSRLDASFMAVPALKKPVSLKEMEELAHEEHAREAAKEGLE